MSKASEVLNGKTFISFERVFMALGIALIIGLETWNVSATLSTKTDMAALKSTIETDVRVLNHDRVTNPRHSARDDASARAADKADITRHLDSFHERLERHERSPHP